MLTLLCGTLLACMLAGGNPEYADTAMPFHTVSTRSLLSVSQGADGAVYSDPYCLDGGAGAPGTIVSISPCLPSQDPVFNRAPEQHFYFSTEGYLKFYNASVPMADWLCVTNRNPDGNSSHVSLYLSACEHSAEQQWAYNGYAPGNGGDGVFSYGVHFIGVMEFTADDDNDTQSSGSDSSRSNELFSGDNLIIWSSAGGFFLVVLLLGGVCFVRRKKQSDISYVYKDNGSGGTIAAAGEVTADRLPSSSSPSPRPSSLHNQQGSVSRHTSSTEMSKSLARGLRKSDAVAEGGCEGGANQA
jgi:hypothetical protein